MRVTPRLPVHGVYLLSPYVEMRYFRFDVLSLPSALLFSLAETCSLPQFSALKDQIQSELNGCVGKDLMTLSMNKDSTTNQILTAWNAQTSPVAELVQFFGLCNVPSIQIPQMWERYGLQVIQCGYEREERTGIETIYLDQCTDGSIVVLYKEYAFDSFVVLEKCKHIYFKAALYRKAREAMQLPRSIQEMATVEVRCEYQGCRTNLNEAIFEIARKDAYIGSDRYAGTMSHSLPVGRISYEAKCLRCGCVKPEFECAEYHKFCVACAAIASYTKCGFSCPICGGRFDKGIAAKITQPKIEIVGVQQIEEMARCSQCLHYKPLTQFTTLKDSTHKCMLCDQCLLALQVDPHKHSQICGSCESELYYDDRQAIIQLQQRQKASAIEEGKEEQKEDRNLCCQLCLVQKTETDYILGNHRNETCCICDKCFYIKVKPFGKCPLCAEGSLSGRSRSDLRCLRCSQDKQPADFHLFMYLQHPCKLCNSCVLSNMRACLVCLESFSEKDLEVIVAKCGLGEGEHCPCGNLIYKGEFSCPGKCFCSVCHLTNMLLSRNRVCPGCASECIGRMPASLECNRCLRTIFSTGPTKLYVSGICTKGHILCQHCVEVNADQLSCPVCHAVVQGKPASELREAQRKLFLACYCEEVGDVDLAELTCGHILHPRCKYNLHYCRVCGSDLLNHCREKPKEVTIWKYAK